MDATGAGRCQTTPPAITSALIAPPRRGPAPGAAVWHLAVVVLASLATYLPTLRNGFLQVGFDDAIIVDTAAIHGLDASHLQAMATQFVHAHYTPITFFSLAVDHALWGLDPFGYHLTNIALHTLAAALVWVLLRPLLPAPGQATLAAVIFAVHPVQLEAVTLAIQRKTLLAAIGFLTTLLCWRRWRGGAGRHWYAAALASFALAALSKPSVVTLPAVLCLYDYTFVDGRPRWRATLPFLAIAAAVTALAVAAHAQIGATHALHGGAVLPHVLMMARVGLESLAAALAPIDLAPVYYYRRDQALAPFNWLALGSVLCLVLWGAVRRRTYPWTFFCLAWFALTLAPESNLVPLAQLRADRFAYLPMVGASAWLALVTYGAAGWLGRPALAPALGAAIATVLAFATMRSAAVWRDDVTAWTRVVERHPWAAAGHLLLGHAYRARGDAARARAAYLAALTRKPEWIEAQQALASLAAAAPPPR